MKNYIKKYIKIAIPIFLLFFLIQIVASNWQEVLVYLGNIQITPLVLSFLILLLIYPESAFAWYTIIKKIGVKIVFKNAFYVWIISNTSRYIPGSIWQYVGKIELGQHVGIPRKESILAILYETLLIAISGLTISLFAVGFWSVVGIKLYMIVLGVGIPIILLHPTISNKILLLIAKLSKKEQLTIIPLKISDYIFILPFFLANFLLNGLVLTFLIFAFTGNFEIEKLTLFSGVYALSWLAGYFSIFAPGGLGVTEVVLALLLSLYVPLPLASAIAIVYRFLLVIAEIIIFVITLKFARSKSDS